MTRFGALAGTAIIIACNYGVVILGQNKCKTHNKYLISPPKMAAKSLGFEGSMAQPSVMFVWMLQDKKKPRNVRTANKTNVVIFQQIAIDLNTSEYNRWPTSMFEDISAKRFDPSVP